MFLDRSGRSLDRIHLEQVPLVYDTDGTFSVTAAKSALHCPVPHVMAAVVRVIQAELSQSRQVRFDPAEPQGPCLHQAGSRASGEPNVPSAELRCGDLRR